MTYREWCIAQLITRFPKVSWYRWADRLEGSDKIIRANYFHPKGIPLDTQAADMDVDIEEVVDFVYKYRRNPWSRRKKPSYDDDPAWSDPNDPGQP